jgi:uncharacterized cupredoxin-like copper-binding protein
MVKGGAGVLHTPDAPKGAPVTPAPTGGSTSPVWPSMVKTTAAAMTSGAPAAIPGAVQVKLGEMYVHAVSSTKAGKVSFQVVNEGQMPHMFGITKGPAQVSRGMLTSKPLVSTAMLQSGDSATVSVKLTPASYELVCLMPGHYAAGQHMAFRVTG